MRGILFLALTAAGLTGCAGRLAYTGPAPATAWQPESTVARGFEQVWAQAVSRYPARGFTIARADKAQGVLTLAYAAAPDAYLDCGRVESVVYTPRDRVKRVYQFPAASGHQVYEQLLRGNIYDVQRDLGLQATIDIKLQRQGRRHTQAVVGAQYQLTRTVQISNATHRPYEPVTDTITLSTRSQAAFPGLESATRCVATGRLEREVLAVLD